MSTMHRDGHKILLPRSGNEEIWSRIFEHYRAARHTRWKFLAMFVLREILDWPIDAIANAFCHPKGHVTRGINEARNDLRFSCNFSPEVFRELVHGQEDDEEQLAA